MKTNFLNLRNFGRKRPKNEQKSMKQVVFTDAARLKRLGVAPMEIFTTFAESRAEMEFLALPNLLHPPKSHAVFCMFWPYFVPRAFCPLRKGLKIKGINRPLHITFSMYNDNN